MNVWRLAEPRLNSTSLGTAAGNGGHEQDFVSIFERVARAAKEADVFFVDIHVQKAANLSGVIAEMRFQIGEFLIQRRKEFVQVSGGAGELGGASGVAAESGWDLNGDIHGG